MIWVVLITGYVWENNVADISSWIVSMYNVFLVIIMLLFICLLKFYNAMILKIYLTPKSPKGDFSSHFIKSPLGDLGVCYFLINLIPAVPLFVLIEIKYNPLFKLLMLKSKV